MNAVETIIKEYPYKLILGSASPRRQELLKSLGFDFLEFFHQTYINNAYLHLSMDFGNS